jgi:5-methylcytosine-specific restriction endonuclease McrA
MKRYHKIWDYSKEYIIQTLNESDSFKEFCNKLDIDYKKSVNTVHKRLKEDELDFSKFKNNRIKNSLKTKEKLNNVQLCENSSTAKSTLKRYLLKCKLIPYICQYCKNEGEWLTKKLSLQLDHINGINSDNRLDNLRWLCPNCHSQTDTFAGRNISKKTERKVKIKVNRPRKFNPSKDELQKLINTKISIVQIGKIYDVSDNAVRKRCKLLEINLIRR